MVNLPIPLVALAAAALAVAVAFDVRSRRVPNAVTVPAAALGLALRGILLGREGIGDGLGGLAVGLCLLLPVWTAGGVGAGDVKLLGAVGAVCGTRFVVWTMLLGAIAGGVMALAALALRGGGKEVLRNVGRQVRSMAALRTLTEVEPTPRSFRMSYAAAIALGAVGAALCL
ncbi:MAG: prepilin peptidase [Armatimonadetes bacterium]|nr:prepilin peptidase [Armatimonadota bacterium]